MNAKKWLCGSLVYALFSCAVSANADSLITVPNSVFAQQPIELSLVQHTQGYNRYIFSPATAGPDSKKLYRGFRTLSDCLDFKLDSRKSSAPGNSISLCDGSAVTLFEPTVTPKLAFACVVPSLNWLSKLLKSNKVRVSKILFDLTFDLPGTPATLLDRAQYTKELFEQTKYSAHNADDGAVIQMYMYYSEGACEVHAYSPQAQKQHLVQFKGPVRTDAAGAQKALNKALSQF